MMPDDALLERYIAGLCTPLERSHVEAWAARDASVAAVLLAARMKGALLDMPTRRIDVERGVARMWAMTSEGHELATPSEQSLPYVDAVPASVPSVTATDSDAASPAPAAATPSAAALGTPFRGQPSFALPPSRSGRWVRWTMVSAALAAALAAGVALMIGVRAHTAGSSAASTRYVTYTTRANQRATITLRDGSRVQLDVASRLDVPTSFDDANRVVRLTGHAVFDVAHRDAAPFVVDMHGARATVLGTVFSARAYEPVTGAMPTDVRVSVQSGKVAMQACSIVTAAPCPTSAAQAVLSANMIGHVDRTDDARAGVSVARDTAIDADFAFMAGRLPLDGASLGRLIPDLERWYDVEIRLADSALAERALGGWLSQGTADDLAQYLTGALHVRVDREGRIMTIHTGAR